jgi:hypothetical protein
MAPGMAPAGEGVLAAAAWHAAWHLDDVEQSTGPARGLPHEEPIMLVAKRDGIELDYISVLSNMAGSTRTARRRGTIAAPAAIAASVTHEIAKA